MAPLFSDLPQAALGALVFVAAIGLADVTTVRRIFTVYRRDGVLALVAAAAVIATGALTGILVAVLISVLTLLFESSRRPVEIVDRVPLPDAPTAPVPAGMLLVRPRADIFFANAQHVRREVQAALADGDPAPSTLVIDASKLSIYEYTADQAMRDMASDLHRRGVEIWAVFPPGVAGEAAMRFRRMLGVKEVLVCPSAAAAIAAYVDRPPASRGSPV